MKSVMFLILFAAAVLASHRSEDLLSNALEELLAEVLEAPVQTSPSDAMLDCSNNMVSPQGGAYPQRGCAGAVWHTEPGDEANARPNQDMCEGDKKDGWFKQCCKWDYDNGQCKPKSHDDILMEETHDKLMEVHESLSEVIESMQSTINCNDLQESMNGPGFEPGCPGAVYSDEESAWIYCTNDSGEYPWWEQCCKWEDDKCKPKDPTIVKKRDGTNLFCEKDGNSVHVVDSLEVCQSEAIDNEFWHFSYSGEGKQCYWSRTCESTVVPINGGEWSIYDIVHEYESMGTRGLQKVCTTRNADDASSSPGDDYRHDNGHAGDNEFYYKDAVELQKCKDLCTSLDNWGCQFISYDYMSGYCYVHQKCLKRVRASNEVSESQIYCKGTCPELHTPEKDEIVAMMNTINETLHDPEVLDDIKDSIIDILDALHIKPGNMNWWDDIVVIFEGLWNIFDIFDLIEDAKKLIVRIHRMFDYEPFYDRVKGDCMELVCEKCTYKMSGPLSLGDVGSVAKCLELCQTDGNCAAVGVGRHSTDEKNKCMMYIKYEVDQGFSNTAPDFDIYEKRKCRECMSLQCKNCGFDGYSVMGDNDATVYNNEEECNDNCLTNINCYGVHFDTELNKCYSINNKEFTRATSPRFKYNAYLKGKCHTTQMTEMVERRHDCGEDYYTWWKSGFQGCYAKCMEDINCKYFSIKYRTLGFLIKGGSGYYCHFFKTCNQEGDKNWRVYKKHTDDNINIDGEDQLDPPSMHSNPSDVTTFKEREGTYIRCEESGNSEHGVDSLEVCKSQAIDNQAWYFSYYEGAKKCYWSSTCKSPIANTGWDWRIYDIGNIYNIQNNQCDPGNQITTNAECKAAAEGFGYDFNPDDKFGWTVNKFSGCLFDIDHSKIRFNPADKSDTKSKQFDAVCRTEQPKSCPSLVARSRRFNFKPPSTYVSYSSCLQDCMDDPTCGGITANHLPYDGLHDPYCWILPIEVKDLSYQDTISDSWKDAWKKSTCYECMNMQCTNCKSAGVLGHELYIGELHYDVCLQACRSDPECYGVDVGRPASENEHDCYKIYKTRTTGTIYSKYFDTWMKGSCDKKSQQFCMVNECYDCEYSGTEKPMEDGDGSVEDCKNLCLEDPSCVAIDVSESYNKCFFVTSIDVDLETTSTAADRHYEAWRKSNDCAYDTMGRVGFKKVCINPQVQVVSPGDDYKKDGGDAGAGEYYKSDQTLQQCKDLCSDLVDWGCTFISWGSSKRACYVHQQCLQFSVAANDVPKSQIYCQGSCRDRVPYESMGTVGSIKVCMNPVHYIQNSTPSGPGQDYSQDNHNVGRHEYYYTDKTSTLDQCKELCSGLAVWGCKFISWDSDSKNCYVHKKCAELWSASGSDVPESQVYCQGVCPAKFKASYQSMDKVGKKKVCINPLEYYNPPNTEDYKLDGGGTGHNEYFYNKKITLEQCKDLCTGLFDWDCKFISWDSHSQNCYVHKTCTQLSSATGSDVPESQIYCKGVCPNTDYNCMKNVCTNCAFTGKEYKMADNTGITVENCSNMCLKEKDCIGINVAVHDRCYFVNASDGQNIEHKWYGWHYQAWKKTTECGEPEVLLSFEEHLEENLLAELFEELLSTN